ncbi:MAG: hypothetical protein WD810_03770 [Solirubrobacterales bacterium]
MDEERISREFEERLARCGAEIRARMKKVEDRWEVGEEARRREWEALEGRLMTAEEKRQHFDDGLFRKMSVMTDEYIRIMREGGDALQREIAEQRAQIRANTEAVLMALDRLPPAQSD